MNLHKATYSLLAVGLLWAQLSGTYTIGDVSAGANYETVAAAFSALMAQGINGNVTFVILPSYTGEDPNTTTSLTLNPYPGMNTYHVTLTVDPSRTTVAEIALDPPATAAERFVLRFNGIRNFTVDGGPARRLRLRVGTPNVGVGVVGLIPASGSPCQNITLRNLEIDGGNKDLTRVGVYIGSASTFPGAAPVGGNNNNLIEGCWIYRVQEGIILYGNSATNRDQNNIVRQCRIGNPNPARSWGGATRSSGIVAAHQDGLRILQDTIFNASSSTNYGYAGMAIGYTPQSTSDAPCVNTHIARNWVHSIEYTGTGGWDVFGIRVNVGSVTNSNIFIYNNFIAGIIADGWSGPAGTWNSYGIWLTGSSNSNAGIYIYHNSIHLYGVPATTSPPSTSTPSCLAIGSGITGGIYVRNNIFQNTQTPAGSGTPDRTTVAVAYAGTAASVFAELDNNAYYVNNSNGSQYAFIGALGSTRYATLSAWQAALGGGREQNSIQFSDTIPFVSDIDPHLPLAAAELEIEGGGSFITTPIAITTDIDGDTRPIGTPTGPDMGADEMQVPPCPPAISAGTISISPASVEAGAQSFTLTASGTVTLPAEWQISIDGGPWTTLQPYSSPSIVYTPQQVGAYAFRIVARVARYHQTCPGLGNDTSNVVSGTATCPANLSVGTISANVTSQPAGNPFVITVTGTVSLPAQWEDSSATSGGWNFVAPYTGSPFNYTIPFPGTRWIRLAALPPSGCSTPSVYSNELQLIATATGNTINDPLDITPRDPTRTDTTVNGDNSVPPFTDTYTGPGNRSSPDVFYMYILRECLDSIRVSLCGGASFDTYLHIINLSASPRQYLCNDDACGLQSQITAVHASSGSTTCSSSPRGSMRLQQGDTLIIVVEGYSSNRTGPFTFQVQEYRYDPTNQPTLPLPPFFSFDTARVCWSGGTVRDTLSTGINIPGVRHVWYRNGQEILGVDTSALVLLINRAGVDTIVVELRSAATSFCAPPASLPRDTIYVLSDSLPDVRFLVNNSPYEHGDIVTIEVTGNSPACVNFAATPGVYDSYSWVINGSIYIGAGPHTECYPVTQTADTVVLITTNGACVKRDSLYIYIDRTTASVRPTAGGLRFYPNPAQEALFIASPVSGAGEVRVYDLRGQMLLSEHIVINAQVPQRVALPALSAGVYLLEVRQGDKLLRERLIIER